MITKERAPVVDQPTGDPPKPPPGIPSWWPWWRMWPAPRGRPQPINRRTVILGALVAIPALFLIDGLLSAMAWYASGSVVVALSVFGALFCFTGLEFALVAYVTKRRQEHESRHAEPEEP
jgi:hypothetical protein